VGFFQGTFARINNEEAAKMYAYSLNSNSKWYRIRSDEGKYRGAWVNAFRAFYTPIEPTNRYSYNSVFQKWVQGGGGDDDENEITPFPSDLFDCDSDFTNYPDEGTGIVSPLWETNEGDVWFTLDGRKLDSKPQTKGIYIYKGKKIVIK
jgi:hypothetical protein